MKKILSISIILLLILDNNFFYILKGINIDRRNLQMVIIIGTLICILIAKKRNNLDQFEKYILLFLGILFLNIIISSILYDQSIFSSIAASKYCFIILSYYIIINYINRVDNIEDFEFIVIKITMIVSLIILIQYILLDKGILFLNIKYGLRYETSRIISSSDFIEVGTILAIGNIFKTIKMRRLISLITAFLGIFNIIFISKGRMALVIIILAITIMLLIYYKAKLLKLIKVFTIIFLILGIFVTSNFFKESIIKTSEADMEGGNTSYSIRIKELNYFIIGITENPIIGNGTVATDNLRFAYKQWGYEGYLDRTDVGIVGFIHCYGVLGLIWYIMLLLNMLKLIIKLCKLNSIKDGIELVGLYIFVIIGSGTLFIMNNDRILLFPIIMGISSFYNRRKINNFTMNDNS